MKTLKRTIKLSIWRRDRFRCHYCGLKLDLDTATVDHKIARANGGTNERDNLVTSCRPCNQKKGLKDREIREHTKVLRKMFPELKTVPRIELTKRLSP